MLKEFELAYNLAPKMTRKQVCKLIQKFENILAERLKEIKQVEQATLRGLNFSAPYQTQSEENQI
ncbi:MAG: hypothetical protein OHK0017_04070 [Patescibacteria group bacterium]